MSVPKSEYLSNVWANGIFGTYLITLPFITRQRHVN